MHKISAFKELINVINYLSQDGQLENCKIQADRAAGRWVDRAGKQAGVRDAWACRNPFPGRQTPGKEQCPGKCSAPKTKWHYQDRRNDTDRT